MWSRGGDRRSLRKIWSDELRLSFELVIWICAVGLMINISERDEEVYIDLKSKQNCQSLMKKIHMASMGHDDVALNIVLDFLSRTPQALTASRAHFKSKGGRRESQQPHLRT
jgi:hypothetical protein